MKRFLPLLLLCLACTSTPPATYAKGAYRPPARAPTFQPHEDAPHTFRPGRPSPVQPGPRSKPVPHTPQTQREDTIWAGDAPRANAEDAPAIQVLDVTMPLKEFADPNIDQGVPRACKEDVLSALKQSKALEQSVRDLTWDERACWVAKTMRICAKLSVAYYLAGLQHAGLSPDRNDPYGRALMALSLDSVAFHDLVCPHDMAAVKDVVKRWEDVAVIKPKGAN